MEQFVILMHKHGFKFILIFKWFLKAIIKCKKSLTNMIFLIIYLKINVKCDLWYSFTYNYITFMDTWNKFLSNSLTFRGFSHQLSNIVSKCNFIEQFRMEMQCISVLFIGVLLTCYLYIFYCIEGLEDVN